MLLGGKLPENNNTYEKQKKHFDEFTLARRKEKKTFTFSGSVLMFEVPENIPEQIWTSSVSLFIFQLVQSLGWNNLSQQKHFFYLICYPESNDYMILFPKCAAGFMNTQVAPQWGPGDSRQIFHVIQPARITVLISDFASPESFNAVFTGSSARRKSSSSVDKGW